MQLKRRCATCGGRARCWRPTPPLAPRSQLQILLDKRATKRSVCWVLLVLFFGRAPAPTVDGCSLWVVLRCDRGSGSVAVTMGAGCGSPAGGANTGLDVNDPANRPSKPLEANLPQLVLPKRISHARLLQDRQAFWTNRVQGNGAVWNTLEQVATMILDSNDVDTASAILAASGVSAPHGDISEVFDEGGARYADGRNSTLSRRPCVCACVCVRDAPDQTSRLQWKCLYFFDACGWSFDAGAPSFYTPLHHPPPHPHHHRHHHHHHRHHHRSWFSFRRNCAGTRCRGGASRTR